MREDATVERGPAWGDVTVGLCVVLIAAICGWETSQIPTNAIYAQVGPKVIPIVACAALGVLGLLLAREGFAGGWEHEGHGEFDGRRLGLLLLGLFLNVALIGTAGFIIASTVLFVMTAFAFGSRAIVLNTLVGFTLALFTYVGFDRVLGYKIGTGLIEAWL